MGAGLKTRQTYCAPAHSHYLSPMTIYLFCKKKLRASHIATSTNVYEYLYL